MDEKYVGMTIKDHADEVVQYGSSITSEKTYWFETAFFYYLFVAPALMMKKLKKKKLNCLATPSEKALN